MSAIIGTGTSNIKQNSPVTDYDDNVYNTITIGDQEWIVTNLKVEHYSDGTSIPNITVAEDWAADEDGAICWYDNDKATYNNVYGALYNWFTIDNVHGLVYFKRNGVYESGWRVPTQTDYNTLYTFLGADTSVGGKLKEVGTDHWLTPNTGATNESGFTALPGGWRDTDGSYTNINNLYYSWASDGFDPNYYYMGLRSYNSYVYIDGLVPKQRGLTIRCVRDV